MQRIANRGIETLVRQATFGDYTGELINSYQAAILKNGKLPYGGDFTMTGQLYGEPLYSYERNSVYKGPNKDIRLITSFGRAHNEISYKKATVVGKSKKTGKPIKKKTNSIALRNDPNRKVNPNVAETIRSPKTTHYQGFGRDITELRTYTPHMKIGFEVVFNNPTPYAAEVMSHAGSRVMPIGASTILTRNDGAMLNLTQAEIWKVVERYKQRLKR